MRKSSIRSRTHSAAAALLLSSSVALAQTATGGNTPSPQASAFAESTFEIWNGALAGSYNRAHTEITYTLPVPLHEGESPVHLTTMIRDVVTPTLTGYFPASRPAALTAVVICPGGGLRFLTWEGEGTHIAEWFAAHGVAAFVLKYRLVPTSADPRQFDQELAIFSREFSRAIAAGKRPHTFDDILPDPATRLARRLARADAQQAIKYVRSRAAEWGISPDCIGMLGFSAGAFLVTDVIMTNDPGSKLDFEALIYGGEAGSRHHAQPTSLPRWRA